VDRLVLGSFAPVAALGEYAGAERITRVFQQGMWPVNQALYPKLTQQALKDPHEATKTVRLSVLFLGALGLILGLVIYVGAPILVHIALGAGFSGAVPVLRVFALWIPLVALCTVITFQVLLPNQLDNQFNVVNLTTAVIGTAAAFLLAPEWKAVGVAWATGLPWRREMSHVTDFVAPIGVLTHLRFAFPIRGVHYGPQNQL
jgi:polysaccharide transporter, PST family